MSFVDDRFGTLATRLVGKFGVLSDFVRIGAETYDENTGIVSAVEQVISTKIVVTMLTAREIEGRYQAGDVKIIADPQPIGSDGIKTGDYFNYGSNGVVKKAIVIDVRQIQGENTVFFGIIARPQ
jgi:hypothetical protein